MSTETFPYAYRNHLTVAGCLALFALLTAVIYAFRATPNTMVLFLGGGSALLMAAIALFAWTIWKDLRSRLQSIVTTHFASGQIIFRQGESADHVYVITKGQVEAVYSDPAKGEVIVARLGPDEYFGETAILSRPPRQG